jgi:[ribosomal protein S18]-alanine N-acetyltransferase
MAVLETLRSFFVPTGDAEPETVLPAAATDYRVKPLTIRNLAEVLRLNIRCFRNGDSYTKYTFEYLLNEPRTLSYRVVTPADDLVAFAFVMVNEEHSAHLTTIGVAPEHRRRGIAANLIRHIENALSQREINTLVLEVRVSNVSAQDLYRKMGFSVVQRIPRYYNNGEDCFLMMKAINI